MIRAYRPFTTTARALSLLMATLAMLFASTGALAQKMASSVSQHGITWYFDQEYPVGRFVTGDWWVVGPVNIVEIDPASITRTDGRTINGSMINPAVSNLYGYDSGGGRSDFYRAELNVASGVGPGSPLYLAPNTSLMSTISHESPPQSTRPLEIGAILTVLAEAPPANSFRPPYVGDDKTVRYTTADVRGHLLPSLARGSIGVPHPETFMTSSISHWDHGVRWQKEHTIPTDNNSGYGRDVSHRFDQALGILISDFPLADKERLLHWFVQVGIDLYGVVDWSLDNGVSPFTADGGHNNGRKMPIIFAGYMLNDSDMLNIRERAGACFFQETAMYGWVDQEDIDETNGPNWEPFYDGSRPTQPYSQDMLGMPEWLADRCRSHLGKNKGNANWHGHPYRLGGNMHVHHMVALGMLSMGLKEQWGNEAFFDYAHRYVAIGEGSPDPFGIGTYGSVEGVPGSSGDAGWRQYWHSKWRYDVFKAHWDKVYNRNGRSPAPPSAPELTIE